VRAGGAAGPAISAHRGGNEQAPAGTYDAYRAALAAGADYVEFDVRRTADGILVSCHADRFGRERAVSGLTLATLRALAGYEVPEVAVLLQLIAGQAGAHVDLKDSACGADVVTLALGCLRPDHIVVTTRDAAVVAELRRQFPAVPLGLTIGGDLAETARFARRRARTRGLSRLAEVEASGAGWAIAHHRLASKRLLAEGQDRGLRFMIWTVNRNLGRWLARPGIDVLVTDQPARAIRERNQRSAR
jgi:glycerophosphoryl diester phosphodiesterase